MSLAGFNLSTETGAQWKAGIFPAWVNAVWVLIICRRSQSAGNSSSTTLLSRVLLFAFRLTKAVYRKHNILKQAKYHSNPTSGRRHHYTGLGAWNSVILEYLPLGSSTTTLDRDSVYARTSTSICLANIKSSTTSCFPFLIELHFLLLDPDLPLYQNKHIPIETRHASPPRVQRQAQLGLYCTRIERFSSEWVSTIHFRLTSRST